MALLAREIRVNGYQGNIGGTALKIGWLENFVFTMGSSQFKKDVQLFIEEI